MGNAEEFKEIIDLVIFFKETNPLLLEKTLLEVKTLAFNSVELSKVVKL